MSKGSNKRERIPKSIRFEVLKRDKFICQYCGASAPDVILHIDHINPVANDGSNEITNLITSCESCNLGKSHKILSDDTAVKKAKNQLDVLQERREQIEMMMEWQRGLRDLTDQSLIEVCQYWGEAAPGFIVNDNGKKKIRKWLRDFSLAEVTQAMNIASEKYLEFQSDGKVTNESWEIAFNKVSGICRVNRQAQEFPDLKEVYYIRGILRNRLTHYFDNALALQLLRNARNWGVSLDSLRSIAYTVTSWNRLEGEIEAAVESTPKWREQNSHI